jgi:Putative prokaryotic signal transducing protein
MADIDPARERKRLEGVYSAMTDEELQAMAEDGASLTSQAVQVLSAEIARRKLVIAVSTSQPGDADRSADTGSGEDEARSRDLVTIRTFQNPSEAEVAKGMFESAGIECFLMDDIMARIYVPLAVGGVRMQVNRADAEAATELLKQPLPESLDVEGVGSYKQPRCPECHSADTTFQRLYTPVIRTYAWADEPVPEKSWIWKCKSCGHEWEDDGNGSGKAE